MRHSPLISSEDFYIPSNQIIFEAIKSLFDNNKPVDVISLADQIDTLYGRELGNIISRVTLSCNEKIVLGEYEKNTLRESITIKQKQIRWGNYLTFY